MVNIFTTVATIVEAEKIAETLLLERLVACVNIWPIRSMYLSDEALKNTEEVGIYLKTTLPRQKAAYQRLLELHPYECPAIMISKVDETHLPYVHWMQDQMYE